MSEVSLEAELEKTSAEDLHVDNEEDGRTEEGLSEAVKQESVDGSSGGDDRDEVLYDIDIDSPEECAGNSDRDLEEEEEKDKGVQIENEVKYRDDDAAQVSNRVETGEQETNHHVERTETPEESGESHTETKVMLTFTLDNQLPLALPRCAGVAVVNCVCCDSGGGGGLFPV